MAPPALLVIDDDQSQLTLTQLAFEQTLPHVTVMTLHAVNGTVGAIKQADPPELPQYPQVILVDYQLGKLDALDLLPALATCWPEVPLVMFSGTLTDRRVDASKAAGAHWCTTKPNTLEEVRELCRDLQELYPALRADGDVVVT